jgi:deazaflavin-dependent oxidoreductase (nitroreductase family)
MWTVCALFRLVMNSRNEFNQTVIDDFRATGGKLSGQFAGTPMLLLHTTGARTGQERVHPVVYLADGEDMVVFASKAGADTNPDWYHNLMAHSRTKVELGSETVEVEARVAEGDERERLWTKQKQEMPNFAEYEQKTTRTIPVVVLQRAS